MHYLNRGLQSGQALLVVPGYFVGNTMLAMVCSLLYQKTYKYLTVFELIIFFFGFSSAIGGVVCMIWKEMHSDLDRTEAWKRRWRTGGWHPVRDRVTVTVTVTVTVRVTVTVTVGWRTGG